MQKKVKEHDRNPSGTLHIWGVFSVVLHSGVFAAYTLAENMSPKVSESP